MEYSSENYSFENISKERNSLTIGEAVKILWKWRKYRNQVFWTSMYRWGAIVFAITIIPYLFADLIGKLGFAIIVFPIMASLLAVFAAYLVMVQYLLYKQVDRKFRSLLGKYNPEEISNNRFIDRIFRISIGKIVGVFFLFFAIIIEFINGFVLFWLIRSALP